jgi:hypothetical protein
MGVFQWRRGRPVSPLRYIPYVRTSVDVGTPRTQRAGLVGLEGPAHTLGPRCPFLAGRSFEVGFSLPKKFDFLLIVGFFQLKYSSS